MNGSNAPWCLLHREDHPPPYKKTTRETLLGILLHTIVEKQHMNIKGGSNNHMKIETHFTLSELIEVHGSCAFYRGRRHRGETTLESDIYKLKVAYSGPISNFHSVCLNRFIVQL